MYANQRNDIALSREPVRTGLQPPDEWPRHHEPSIPETRVSPATWSSSWVSDVLQSALHSGRRVLSNAPRAILLWGLRRLEPAWAKPRHAAFILDGNRRYAVKAKLPACRMGHQIGARRFHELIEYCRRYGIRNLAVYAFSIENFSRSEKEISAILDIVRSTCDGILDPENDVHRVGCRLRVIGDRSLVPEAVRASIEQAEECTKHHSAMTVFMSVAYDGREEIARAVRRCVTELRNNDDRITIADLSRAMYIRAHAVDVPPVDLIVRTGGARRLSSFLMWDSSHAEIHFDDTLLPDFGEVEFLRALAAFNRRVRSSQAIQLNYWNDAAERQVVAQSA